MKRELASLETGSPIVLDSNGRKTRSRSKQLDCEIDSDGVSEQKLVYKRVKRSVQAADLLSNGSKDNGVVVPHVVVHEERESGVAGVSSEVVKSAFGEGVNGLPENTGNLMEDDGLLKNVKTDDGKVVESSIEEQGMMMCKDGTTLTEAGDSVISNVALNGNVAAVVEDAARDRVAVEETLVEESPSTVVNENAKKSSVERTPRRFTRSALKCNVDIEANADKVTPSETQLTENNQELNSSVVKMHERRLTRSSLKPKVDGKESCLTDHASESVILDKENTEPIKSDEKNAEADMEKDSEESMSVTSKNIPEMKLSKQVELVKIPTTVRELFETGLLEGCPVYYNGGKGPGLRGRIRGLGILCSCGLCQESKVVAPSVFEIHACNTYKRAAQYICLENGRSFIEILKACRSTRLKSVKATILNAIGPLPEKKLTVCQNCKEAFSTMEAESSEPVCGSCVMSSLSPIGPVYSSRLCSFSKSFSPLGSPQAASTRDNKIKSQKSTKKSSNSVSPLRDPHAASTNDMIQVASQESIKKSPKSVYPLRSSQAAATCEMIQDVSQTSIKKSPKAFLTPKLRSSPRIGKSSETNTSGRREENFQEVFDVPNTCTSLSMGKSSESKTHEKPMRKSLDAASSPKLSRSNRVGKSSPAIDNRETKKRSRKEGLQPKPSNSPSVQSSSEKNTGGKTTRKSILAPKPSSQKKTAGKITRKDLRLHKVVFEDDVLPDGTELGYYARGQKLLDGYKQGSGIFCNCCDTVISASQFEAHAGCASRRKPYCYIYTSNGVSLHELSISLIQGRSHSAKFNDDLCSICADGGNLLLCDGCPRAFHMECASLSNVPRGKWYCKYCQNMFEREKFVAHNVNAVAAGRVSGVDPIDQITKRSIRIVSSVASEISSCILCRGFDFCKSGFGPRTIILCDQCEKEYHVGCLKDHKMADLTELPEGKWFCNIDCQRIESALQKLLVQGAEKLPESIVSTIRTKHLQTGSEFATDVDVSWRLLSGKIACPETRPLLSQAVAIFHESFAPIIDVVSGHDLIPAMVYGRNVGGQEYGGMYCAVLTINSVVVSAGIFRVFGPEVAELPLVATSSENQGKGYFQTLFGCIERLFAALKVKSFVLPAAVEAESIWVDRFGFTKMTLDQHRELKRNFWSLVRFQGTSMLHKSVPGVST